MPECPVCFYLHSCQTFAKVQLIVVTFFENLRFAIVYLLFFIKPVDELPPRYNYRIVFVRILNLTSKSSRTPTTLPLSRVSNSKVQNMGLPFRAIPFIIMADFILRQAALAVDCT